MEPSAKVPFHLEKVSHVVQDEHIDNEICMYEALGKIFHLQKESVNKIIEYLPPDKFLHPCLHQNCVNLASYGEGALKSF